VRSTILGESLLITAAGSVIGVVLSHFPGARRRSWPSRPWSLAWCGDLPARRAARLKVISALTYK